MVIFTIQCITSNNNLSQNKLRYTIGHFPNNAIKDIRPGVAVKAKLHDNKYVCFLCCILDVLDVFYVNFAFIIERKRCLCASSGYIKMYFLFLFVKKCKDLSLIYV